MKARVTSTLLLVTGIVGQQPLPSPSPSPAAAGPTATEVAAQLRGDRAVDVAVGAYLARKLRLRDVGGELRQALRTWRDRDGDEARYLRMHLVDALWGIEADVPAEEIAFLLDDEFARVPALLVLLRDPKRHAEALARVAMGRAPADDLVRYLAARALVEQGIRTEGLAAHLLQHADHRLVVAVGQPSPFDGPAWNAGFRLGGVAAKLESAPEGFPPYVHHVLLRIPAENVMPRQDGLQWLYAAAGGLPAICHRRSELPRFTVPQQRPESTAAPAGDLAMELLELMAATGDPGPRRIEVEWHGPERLRTDVAKVQAEQRARLDRLVVALRKRGWLGEDELRGFHVPLRIELLDLRPDRTEPLPAIER